MLATSTVAARFGGARTPRRAKGESLGTEYKNEARRLLDARIQPHNHVDFHVQMVRTHLLVSGPKAVTCTWQDVMDGIVGQKTGVTKIRWERAAKAKVFDSIRKLVMSNTKSD